MHTEPHTEHHFQIPHCVYVYCIWTYLILLCFSFNCAGSANSDFSSVYLPTMATPPSDLLLLWDCSSAGRNKHFLLWHDTFGEYHDIRNVFVEVNVHYIKGHQILGYGITDCLHN